MMASKPAGLTASGGFQVGARKTLPTPPDHLWSFLLSAEGRKIWLGEIPDEPFLARKEFTTTHSVKGRVTTLQEGSHLRMQWKKKGWSNTSILQVRVIPLGERSTLSFHQEKMMNAKQREEMKTHWQHILKRIAEAI